MNPKNLSISFVAVLAVAVLATACKPESSAAERGETVAVPAVAGVTALDVYCAQVLSGESPRPLPPKLLPRVPLRKPLPRPPPRPSTCPAGMSPSNRSRKPM